MGLYARHATWLPWTKTVRGSDVLSSGLIDALTAWLDALHEFDSASLGYVVYDELAPAQLSEAAQAEWRRAILELEGSRKSLSLIRPFLLCRPELVRMAESIDNSPANGVAGTVKGLKHTSGARYNYAVLLKDMAGYTIEGCPERSRWRSRHVSLEMRPTLSGRNSGAVWIEAVGRNLQRAAYTGITHRGRGEVNI